MKTRIFAILLVAAMLLCVLTACGGGADVITSEQAQKIAIKEAGLKSADVTDVHTHIVTEDGTPCYNVHITADGKEFSFVIRAADGEILN